MSRFVRRTRAIAHKELIHMLRDARVIYLALGLPVVMLALFGYAVSLDIDHIPLGVVDQDRTRASRRLAEGLVAGGLFVRTVDLDAPEQADPLFRRGRIKALLVLPRGYERGLERGDGVEAQLLVDGSDGSVAAVAIGDAVSIAGSLALGQRALARASLSEGRPIRIRFNPGMRSAYSIVPGVIVMILGMVTTLLTALTVAREWERGNMEQLFATPVSRSQIIVGKLLPYAALGMVQTLLILTLGSCLFRVPIAGSPALLFGASVLFLLCMIGIGLFVSVATKSQLVAVQLSAMLGYMPAMLLSGFLFPIANMPWWLQGLSSAFPARYYLSALRGILLKGNGLAVLAPHLLALASFAFAALTLAVRTYRRRLA
jgi:drug efflux transport system permease protein